MVCRVGTNVIACGPPAGVYRRKITHCGECGRRHRFIVRWDGAWYGTTMFGACGDMWQDGEMAERPFQRGWRTKSQQRFREMWEHAATRDLYEAYVRADCEMATAFDDEWQDAARRREAALAAIHHTPTPDQDAADNASDADHHRETWEADLRDGGDINFERETEQ